MHDCKSNCIRTNPRPRVRHDDKLLKNGDVIAVGFERVRGSAHSLKQFFAIIAAAKKKTRKIWRWQAPFVFFFHTKGRALGTAWPSDYGNNGRVISLKHDLLADYDAASVQRTVTHEMCHHYRHERFPVHGKLSNKGHDTVFCRELGRIDPIVKANQKSCQFFQERKTPEAENRAFKGIILKPGAGALQLRRKIVAGRATRKLELVWAAKRGRSFVTKFTDNELSTIMKRAGKASWRRITTIDHNGRAMSMLEFARYAVSNWRRHFVKTAELLRS